MIEQVTATRYVTPLREGGSLPGIVEASDFGTYVVKFRGAGQGLKVLVAEIVVGELARRLGLRVPEDLSLVGFDNIPESALTDPPLTTVHQPMQRLGFEAVQMLLQLLEGRADTPTHVRLDTSLVERRSTGRPRA